MKNTVTTTEFKTTTVLSFQELVQALHDSKHLVNEDGPLLEDCCLVISKFGEKVDMVDCSFHFIQVKTQASK